MKKCIFLTIVAGISFVVFLFVLNEGINRHEIQECLLWKDQAVEYHDAGFYLTEWQYAQCLAHRVFIDAPVIK